MINPDARLADKENVKPPECPGITKLIAAVEILIDQSIIMFVVLVLDTKKIFLGVLEYTASNPPQRSCLD